MLDNLRAVVAETPGPRRYLPVVVPEPLDEVADIRLQFYADPARYGYTFQTAIFVARVQIFRRLLRKALADPNIDEDTTVVFLQDRSSLSDVLFVDNLHLSGAMSPLEYATFRSSWYDFWLDILFGELNAGPDVIVYLRTPLADCMARIAKRAREGEATLPESYQVALQQRHDDRYLGDLVHVTDRASVPCICTTDPDIGISKPKLTALWTRILDIITGGRDYIDRASLSPQVCVW